MLLPREQRRIPLTLAAVPIHVGLSFGWTAVMSVLLPRKKPVLEGVLAGLAIAALDLGVVGRRYPRIKALPVLPQIADHVAFGIIASVALARQESL